jgi:predicted GTPase
VDPLRPGHERTYYPGSTNVRLADVIVVNKVDSAPREQVDRVIENVRDMNPDATIIEGASPISAEDPATISGKRVLVVEDGPTLTHGGMKYGAGTLAAKKFGASEIVDPKPYAVRTIAETFRKYPDTGVLLPAMGYGPEQMQDLEETIERVPCDTVLIGTPVDLRRVIRISKATTRVQYSLEETTKPDLEEVLRAFLERRSRGQRRRRKT